MSNAINLATEMVGALDEVFKRASLTDNLTANNDLVRTGLANANEVQIQNLTLQGLGDYTRPNGGTGFPEGEIKLVWETRKLEFDRGQGFVLDAMDENEARLSAATVVGEFLRTHVIPEVDAIRFARLAENTPATNLASSNLTSSNVTDVIDEAIEALDEKEVPESNRILYVSNEVHKLLKNSPKFSFDLAQRPGAGVNRIIRDYDEIPVFRVPRTRFYSAIETHGSTPFGYNKDAENGKDINFMLVYTPSASGLVKHSTLRMFAPDTNQVADAWKLQYRMYHDLIVWDNKKTGLYTHTKTT